MPKVAAKSPIAPTAAAPDPAAAVAAARSTMLEGVGREIAASFPGITRLGGQIVAALYLADEPLSMDALCEMLGRSKSNVFSNLRALEGAAIVQRQRATGTRHDTFALRGKYPDVVVGAYLGRLRRVVVDKVELCDAALGQLGDARGDDADSLRERLTSLQKKYERFQRVFDELGPVVDGPVDLEEVLDRIPTTMLPLIAGLAKRVLKKR